MDTYQKCKAIQAGILRVASEAMLYQTWEATFVKSRIQGIPWMLDHVGLVDPNDLTENELIDLGFGRWSQDSPMYLIPLWLFPFLAHKIKARCVNGEEREYLRSEMDNDNRFGCLAYGIVPKSA